MLPFLLFETLVCSEFLYYGIIYQRWRVEVLESAPADFGDLVEENVHTSFGDMGSVPILCAIVVSPDPSIDLHMHAS